MRLCRPYRAKTKGKVERSIGYIGNTGRFRDHVRVNPVAAHKLSATFALNSAEYCCRFAMSIASYGQSTAPYDAGAVTEYPTSRTLALKSRV